VKPTHRIIRDLLAHFPAISLPLVLSIYSVCWLF